VSYQTALALRQSSVNLPILLSEVQRIVKTHRRETAHKAQSKRGLFAVFLGGLCAFAWTGTGRLFHAKTQRRQGCDVESSKKRRTNRVHEKKTVRKSEGGALSYIPALFRQLDRRYSREIVGIRPAS
jgi:hypothetical protein